MLRTHLLLLLLQQMAANDVGSLLVYDKDKAGPGNEVPQTVDACVGIITERGRYPFFLGGGSKHSVVSVPDQKAAIGAREGVGAGRALCGSPAPSQRLFFPP